MIRASTLFIVIIISFLMASITGSIVYATFYYTIQVTNHTSFTRAVHNVNSGVAYLLSSPRADFDEKLDLYGDGEDTVWIRNKPWGLYSIASVEARTGHQRIGRQFMYGYAMDKTSKVAIRLNNSDRYLNVSGNTQIVGDCFLPGGITRTMPVGGFSYQGTMPVVKGKVNNSSNVGLTINGSMLDALENLLTMQHVSSTAPADGSVSDSLIHSFADSTLYLNYSDGRLQSASYVEGNIVLYSQREIVLRPNMLLQDVIVVAPSVNIPSGYKGVVQVICSDSIVVEENVHLNYPSSLVLIKGKGVMSDAHIVIKKNTEISGVVFAYSALTSDDKLDLKLSDHSIVRGQVYCSSAIHAQGFIYGEVVCDHFMLKVNKNYLLNSVIDVSKRSAYFIGSNILPVSNSKNVIKWF